MDDREVDPEVWEDIGKRGRLAKERPDRGEDGFRAQLAKTPAPPPTPARTECPTCHHIVLPFYRTCPQCEGDKNRRKVDALAEVIRELKAGKASAETERRLVKQLYELGHPDPKGLLATLEAKRTNGGPRRGA